MTVPPRTPWPRPKITVIATLPQTSESVVWVSPHGTQALVAGKDPLILLYDLQRAERVAELGPVDDWVAAADATRDGTMLVTAGGGKCFTRKVPVRHSAEFLREWQDAREGEYWPLSSEREETVFEPRDHRVWCWNVATRACVQHIAGAIENVIQVKIAPNGSLVMAMDDGRKMYAFQTVDGHLLGQWKAPTRASSMALERNDGLVLVGSESGRLYLLDVRHERMVEIKLSRSMPHFDALRSLVSSPCGRYAVGTTEYGAELFDLQRNASLGIMYRKNIVVHAVEVSRYDMRIVFRDDVHVSAAEFSLGA